MSYSDNDSFNGGVLLTKDKKPKPSEQSSATANSRKSLATDTPLPPKTADEPPVGPDGRCRDDRTQVFCDCGHRPTCDCHRQPLNERGAPCGKGRHPFWDEFYAKKWRKEEAPYDTRYIGKDCVGSPYAKEDSRRHAEQDDSSGMGRQNAGGELPMTIQELKGET